MSDFIRQYKWLIIEEQLWGTKSWLVKLQDDKNWPFWTSSIQKVVENIPENIWVLLNLNISEIREKIESSTVLIDFFEVNEKWEIIVKSVENSNWLKWHFSNMPIVPWVALKELFKAISWIEIERNWYESVDFLDMAIPWSIICVKEDWLYIDNKIIMKIKLDTKPEEHQVTSLMSIYKNPKNEEVVDITDVYISPTHSISWGDIDNYLFQKPPFQFATSCDLYLDNPENIGVWDIFKWSYNLDTNSKYLDKNWNIDSSLLAEISAQIASMWFSFINNKWIENDSRKKLLTFANSTTKNYPLPEKTSTEFKFEWEITNIDDKTITINYRLKNQDNNILQEWSIKWWIRVMRAVKFMHSSKSKKNNK